MVSSCAAVGQELYAEQAEHRRLLRLQSRIDQKNKLRSSSTAAARCSDLQAGAEAETHSHDREKGQVPNAKPRTLSGSRTGATESHNVSMEALAVAAVNTRQPSQSVSITGSTPAIRLAVSPETARLGAIASSNTHPFTHASTVRVYVDRADESNQSNSKEVGAVVSSQFDHSLDAKLSEHEGHGENLNGVAFEDLTHDSPSSNLYPSSDSSGIGPPVTPPMPPLRHLNVPSPGYSCSPEY